MTFCAAYVACCHHGQRKVIRKCSQLMTRRDKATSIIIPGNDVREGDRGHMELENIVVHLYLGGYYHFGNGDLLCV